MCKVSIVTSVYNCEKYIGETIKSVINQSFNDWEFIIINDCSVDRSADIIKRFTDPRIKLINNNANKGQSASLNFGIEISKGEYIARLDHDDICYKERLEKQVKYMDNNPDTVLVGTWFDYIIANKIKKLKLPEFNDEQEVMFSHSFFNYCFPHSSFMIRKKAMVDNNIWYGKCVYAEDYELLLRLMNVGNIDYIHENLISYRIFPEQTTQTLSNQVKRLEVSEIRCNYFDTIDFKYKNYIKKAIRQELKTEMDYKKFVYSLIKYAEYCGINTNITRGRIKNESVKKVYRDICIVQKKSLCNLIMYLRSPFREYSWLVSRVGLGYAARCLLGYNKN